MKLTKGTLAALSVQDFCRKHGYPVPVTEHRFMAFVKRVRSEFNEAVTITRKPQ